MSDLRCAVLIVEDDEKLQDLLKTMLDRYCSSIDVAADGDSGIDRLRAGTYEAVIVDLMLPRKNGLLVIDAMESLPYTPKVIVLSAISRYFHDRFPPGTLVLQKPFEIDKVVPAITAIRDQSLQQPRP